MTNQTSPKGSKFTISEPGRVAPVPGGHRPTHSLLLLALLLLFLPACNYTTGPAGLYRDDVQTVAVVMFENRTFYTRERPQVELAEALAKRIEQHTPYKITSPATADTQLTGTITNIRQSSVSRRIGTGLPNETEVLITVDFEWLDLRSGEVLTQRQGFTAAGRYVPNRNYGESFSVAQHAAIERLTRDITGAMQLDWQMMPGN